MGKCIQNETNNVYPPPPFPNRVAKHQEKKKKKKEEKDILKIFNKVEVNIPLLNVIKQILRYARFLKELCKTKKRLQGNERITLNKNVSTLI